MARRALKSKLRSTKRLSWKVFTSLAVDMKTHAKLNKIIYREKNPRIGSIRTNNGITTSQNETLLALLKEHFPQCRTTNLRSYPSHEDTSLEVTSPTWITAPLIKQAIAKFKPFKAPGPDDIPPCALKNLPKETLESMVALYTASMYLNHIPKIWSTAKVVFIPKPGRTDYSDPRSHRPITLTSFILKTIERLILWHLDDTSLRDHPLHEAQFGFRHNRSTDNTVSCLVSTVEKNFSRNQKTLGVFLDIKGAFDNTNYSAIRTALNTHHTPPEITEWCMNILQTRTTFAQNESTKDKIVIQHSRGVPQGGILSPTLWNLAFDSLLEKLQTCTDQIIAYADDVCFLITYTNVGEAEERTNTALQKAYDWSINNNLEFCPAKSEFMIFGKKKTDPALAINLGNNILDKKETITYLGVHLTPSLSWNDHIKTKITQAKKALAISNAAFGKIWGPMPKMMLWTFKAIATPKVLYASHVWHKDTYRKQIQARLLTLTRQSLLHLAPSRLKTPSAGLQIILGSIPLHLVARERNTRTMLRVLGFEPSTAPSHKGHIRHIHNDYASVGLAGFALDDIPRQKLGQTLYRVQIDLEESIDTPSVPVTNLFPDGTTRSPPHNAFNRAIYTDGSKLENRESQGTGCGLAFFPTSLPLPLEEQPAIHIKSIQLCHTFTVFQAEVTAISEALREYHRLIADKTLPLAQSITIYSDSQSALQALCATYVDSKLVLECVTLLNATATTAPFTLRWVKAHVGTPGNELADTLAKEGAKMKDLEGPSPFGPISYTFIRSVMRQETMDTWNDTWLQNTACRQTKLWFPEVNLALSRKVITLDRETLGRFIRWITSHNFLRRHQNLLDPENSPTKICRLCHQEPETAEHIIADCVVLDPTRTMIFNTPRLTKPYVWQFADMKNFLTTIAETMERDGDLTPIKILGPNNEHTEIFLDSVIPHDFTLGERNDRYPRAESPYH